MYRFRVKLVAVTMCLLLAGLTACQQGAAPETAKEVGAAASATIIDLAGSALGTVTLVQGPQGVLISAELEGVPPGGHGFHIHGVGACSPDFSAAGGHFDPEEQSHGFLYATGKHAGDLPNIFANADGWARADIFTDEVTLASGEDNTLFDADGSAIIIHEQPDAYGEDAGTAGARIACGVIEKTS